MQKGKRSQQPRPEVLDTLLREGVELAQRWIPKGASEADKLARTALDDVRAYRKRRQQIAARKPRRALLLWILPLPLIAASLIALASGQFSAFINNAGAYGLFLAAAMLARVGFQREVDSKQQRFQTAISFPFKALGALTTGLATAFTAWAGAGHDPLTATAFGIGATTAFVLLYGLDPRRQASVITSADGNAERISAALQQAEQQILAIDRDRSRISQPELNQRLDRITERARDILTEIARDPKDFRRARKFLNTYLDGAQRVVAGYARAHENDQHHELESNFRRVLVTIEQVFDQQYQKLLQNDLQDLDIQMEVLATQLKTEGLS